MEERRRRQAYRVGDMASQSISSDIHARLSLWLCMSIQTRFTVLGLHRPTITRHVIDQLARRRGGSGSRQVSFKVTLL